VEIVKGNNNKGDNNERIQTFERPDPERTPGTESDRQETAERKEGLQ
jgi:hypothetical protein